MDAMTPQGEKPRFDNFRFRDGDDALIETMVFDHQAVLWTPGQLYRDRGQAWHREDRHGEKPDTPRQDQAGQDARQWRCGGRMTHFFGLTLQKVAPNSGRFGPLATSIETRVFGDFLNHNAFALRAQ